MSKSSSVKKERSPRSRKAASPDHAGHGQTLPHTLPTPGTPEARERLEWAFRYCHDKGLRKTRARDALLTVLAGSGPTNWRTLSDTPPLSELCNPSTVFRLLVRLEEIGLVRRITVREKPPFFTMGDPGARHNDYVVCTECASVQNLQITCPGSRLERQLEEEFGFRRLHHEFAFYGVCRECSDLEQPTPKGVN